MKQSLLVFGLLSIASTSMAQSGTQPYSINVKRAPSSVKDVGKIGPNGTTVLYYAEGNNIVSKYCRIYTTLGETPAEAKKNCDGKTIKVSVDSFKKHLKSFIKFGDFDTSKVLFNPLTPSEVEAYRGYSAKGVEAMREELSRINRYISTYGEDNANLERRAELTSKLSEMNDFDSAVKKINKEIENVVSSIESVKKLTLIKTSSNKDEFSYNALRYYYPPLAFFPCGQDGSIEERMEDCSYMQTSDKENFSLVSSVYGAKDLNYRVYKDKSSGLIWSSPYVYGGFENAKSFCKSGANQGWDNFGKLSGLKWRLPTLVELQAAARSGLGHGAWSWTSTSDIDRPDGEANSFYEGRQHWIVNSHYNSGDARLAIDESSNQVRCVAEPEYLNL